MDTSTTSGPWYTANTGNHQGLVISETGVNVAVAYDKADAPLLAAAPDLLQAAKCALADLEGILPEYDPDGDRRHPAWTTMNELRDAIAKATA